MIYSAAALKVGSKMALRLSSRRFVKSLNKCAAGKKSKKLFQKKRFFSATTQLRYHSAKVNSISLDELNQKKFAASNKRPTSPHVTIYAVGFFFSHAELRGFFF